MPSSLGSGTGSQIFVYDLATGDMIRSFQVFEGIRVHGIALEEFRHQLFDSFLAFRIAVYGEKRVKLFNLCFPTAFTSQNRHGSGWEVELILIHALPKFSHWILDVCFLNVCIAPVQSSFFERFIFILTVF